MNKIYGFGTGGKHRSSADAQTWRTATAQAAKTFRETHPEMSPEIAGLYAEDAVRHAFSAANRSMAARTLPTR
jgi:hypothetical protein